MKNVILLADNNAVFRDKWGKILVNAGFEVKYASNPQQARNILQNAGVDLAILDLRLEDDDDENDLSGLDLALEEAFKYTPKIVLTAFKIEYKNLRKALGTSIDELPPTVAFMDKTEGPDALIEVIRYTLETWPKLRMSTLKVSAQIKTDHDVARQQARLNFKVAFTISIIGFLVIFAGISLAWFERITMGIVGTTSGIILEALGYLFFTRLDRSNDRMDTYHRELLQTYWVEYLLAACEQLPYERQMYCKERTISAAIDSWFAHKSDSETPPSEQMGRKE